MGTLGFGSQQKDKTAMANYTTSNTGIGDVHYLKQQIIDTINAHNTSAGTYVSYPGQQGLGQQTTAVWPGALGPAQARPLPPAAWPQQHLNPPLPAPTGVMTEIPFSDLDGNCMRIKVDVAYASILSQIGLMHEIIIKRSGPPDAPSYSGDFSEDEMSLAESVIDEMEGKKKEAEVYA